MNAYASEHYHASIGSAPKPVDSVYSWNKNTMAQNLRRMQYAVRGEVVIRADASECVFGLWKMSCIFLIYALQVIH